MYLRGMSNKIILPDNSEREIHLNGWKKDKPDTRDFKLKSLASSLPGAKLNRPLAVDLSKKCSNIENQQNLGSCTAQMLAGIVEYNNIKWADKPSRKQVSRLFEYYATRLIDGTTEEDSGAYIRDAIKAAAKYGCIWESKWKYDISKFAVNPPQVVWNEAAQHKIVSYFRIEDGDIETMKQTLASGYLIGFGFVVYDNMMNYIKGDILSKPDTNASMLGGHAVVLVGYDDSKNAFKVRNSWGKEWGDNGYFWIAYDYVKDTNLANDFWVVNSVNKI